MKKTKKQEKTVSVMVTLKKSLLKELFSGQATEKEEKQDDLGYLGKFVFLENSDNDGSHYNDGEYVVVAQTPMSIHCIKTSGGYGSHSTDRFSLVGKSKYNIIESRLDLKALKTLVSDLKDFANTPKGSRSWVESVYTGAMSNALRLERIIEQLS